MRSEGVKANYAYLSFLMGIVGIMFFGVPYVGADSIYVKLVSIASFLGGTLFTAGLLNIIHIDKLLNKRR